MVEIEELSIKSPLGKDRFLGWYVDGEWSIKDKTLNFLDFKEKSFLLTNNLIMKSNKILFEMEIKVEHDLTQFKNKKPMMDTNEVLVMSLSPHIYPVKNFATFSPLSFISGYCLFLFQKEDKAVLFLDEVERGLGYDMRMIYDYNYTYDKRKYCELDYRNKTLNFKILFNFDSGNFKVSINNKACIRYKINQRIFNENKVGFTFTGFSSGISPISVYLKNVSVKKNVLYKPVNAFHSTVYSFQSSLRDYDQDHQNEASLSNIMLMQAKINKEINQNKQFIELLAKRSRDSQLSIYKASGVKVR